MHQATVARRPKGLLLTYGFTKQGVSSPLEQLTTSARTTYIMELCKFSCVHWCVNRGNINFAIITAVLYLHYELSEVTTSYWKKVSSPIIHNTYLFTLVVLKLKLLNLETTIKVILINSLYAVEAKVSLHSSQSINKTSDLHCIKYEKHFLPIMLGFP